MNPGLNEAQQEYALPVCAYDDVKRVFEFFSDAHRSSIGDIYSLYIVFALGLAHQNSPVSIGRLVTLTPRTLNLLTIAEMTGIPRETVRRKLRSLMDLQIVQQRADRTYGLVNGAILAKAVTPLKFKSAHQA